MTDKLMTILLEGVAIVLFLLAILLFFKMYQLLYEWIGDLQWMYLVK